MMELRMDNHQPYITLDDPQSDLAHLLENLRGNDDELGSIAEGKNIVCLELYRDPDLGVQWCSNALLLQRDAKATEYTRIGFLDRVPSSWFDEYGVQETITIM